MKKVIYYLTMIRSRKSVIELYGEEFWKNFKKISYKEFKALILVTPDIGDSIFKVNYQCAPAYAAWYKTMKKLGLSQKQSDKFIANLMGNGFTRTKTLGDKDSCCNCHYELRGKCEWAPEKGFITRK